MAAESFTETSDGACSLVFNMKKNKWTQPMNTAPGLPGPCVSSSSSSEKKQQHTNGIGHAYFMSKQ